MRLAAVNATCNNKQSKQNFTSKVEFTKSAQELVEFGLKIFHDNCAPDIRLRFFGDEPFNAKKILEGFKKALQRTTDEVDKDGIIRIDTTQFKYPLGEGLKISYIDENKHVEEMPLKLHVYNLTPDSIADKQQPYAMAVNNMVGHLRDLTIDSEDNRIAKRFVNLYEKLSVRLNP